jgi:hypothetical protein
MILHAMPHDVGHFVKSPVILLVERVQDPALYRLQPVFKLRNGPIPDDVRSILEEILVDQILQWIFGQMEKRGGV